MKYLSSNLISLSLRKIFSGEDNREHVTGRAAFNLSRHYFPQYSITPEKILESNRRPDTTIEKLVNDDFIPHAFVEVKSLVNSNFNAILDQLQDTILQTVDAHGGLGGNFSIFVIAMKGAQIAFFEYHSFVTLLDECGIIHYRGFIPLGYNIPFDDFFRLNPNYLDKMEYARHYCKTGIPFRVEELRQLGVQGTSKIEHPHI